MPHALLLGAADLIADELPEIKKRRADRNERVERFLETVVDKLCDYLQTDFAKLRPYITDFLSCGPAVYNPLKYHDTMHKADRLGLTGTNCQFIDQGGASITSALVQAHALVQQNPRACVLIAAADILRAGFQGKADYQTLNAGAMHPLYETPYGGQLIAFYALLAKRQMRDHDITEDELRAIARYFHKAVQDNPRAANYGKTLEDKELQRYFAEPYSSPMIALLTDHAVATLVCGEDMLDELRGVLTPPAAPVYIGQGVTAHHAAYFSLKGNLESPSRITGPAVLARNGLTPVDVDYAWIYDCFVGMIIEQASNYFGISQKDAARDLGEGCVRVKDAAGNTKTIPVNQGGGILNYQAALMLSSGVGLMDVLSQYGLAADPVVPSPAERPRYALLGGNGGIDAVNGLVLIAVERPRSGDTQDSSGAQFVRPKLSHNNPANVLREGERGRIVLTTVVHFQTGGPVEAPYVLAIVENESGPDYCVCNVFRNGEMCTSDAELPAGTDVVMRTVSGLVQAVVE